MTHCRFDEGNCAPAGVVSRETHPFDADLCAHHRDQLLASEKRQPVTDSIADKARAYLALSKAATPDWREVPNPLGGKHHVMASVGRDGFMNVIAAFPPHNPASEANRALAVLGRNIGDEMAEALLVAVEALLEIRDTKQEALTYRAVAGVTLRKLGLEPRDD